MNEGPDHKSPTIWGPYWHLIFGDSCNYPCSQPFLEPSAGVMSFNYPRDPRGPKYLTIGYLGFPY